MRFTTRGAARVSFPGAGTRTWKKTMNAFSTTRLATLLLSAAALAVPALAQQPSPLMLPPQLEKELAARASDVTEVTLNKNMLGFAAKFMHDSDENEASARQLIEGLDGIYVRDYEFDKDGEYDPSQLEQLRRAFNTPEWQPMIHEHERRSGETTDILMKVVNGENKGLFILNAEPRELSIVLILGPIRMQDLGKLHGVAGLGAALAGPIGPLSGVQHTPRGNGSDKDKDKDKTRDRKDGSQ
jgi:hypothetical protein